MVTLYVYGYMLCHGETNICWVKPLSYIVMPRQNDGNTFTDNIIVPSTRAYCRDSNWIFSNSVKT